VSAAKSPAGPHEEPSERHGEVRAWHGDGVCVVDLDGDLAGPGTASLAAAIDAAVAAEPSALDVDLRDCTGIDSSVLALLLRADRQMRRRGGELTVVADSPRILRIFERTGLDRLLTLVRRPRAA
jgi:anti-sigma B factor antagonist